VLLLAWRPPQTACLIDSSTAVGAFGAIFRTVAAAEKGMTPTAASAGGGDSGAGACDAGFKALPCELKGSNDTDIVLAASSITHPPVPCGGDGLHPETVGSGGHAAVAAVGLSAPSPAVAAAANSVCPAADCDGAR